MVEAPKGKKGSQNKKVEREGKTCKTESDKRKKGDPRVNVDPLRNEEPSTWEGANFRAWGEPWKRVRKPPKTQG